MLRSLGLSLFLLVSAGNAFAQPLKYICETPRGKRVQATTAETDGGIRWIDDDLENVRPALVIDGEIFSVTWGTTVSNQAKSNAPKATTYVFASTFRDDLSIFATRIDRTQAEIFRFYFGDKLLYKLTSSPSTSKDNPVAAIHVASCRQQ